MIAALIFIGSFALYLFTLSGSVPAYRDSGDMINAIYTLGIAHPPGYPLYVLLGKLATVVMPFANPAYQVNVFSALCAAVSVVLLYKALSGRDGLKMPCIIAVILYAVSPAVLDLARVSEMYALAAVFGAGIVSCYLIDTPRSLLLGSFLLGTGFGVHPTLLFLGPLLVPKRDNFFRDTLARLGFFLLGFSIVLVPWVRAGASPVQNWGNPNTLAGLWTLLSRGNYGGLKLHPVESQFVWTASGVLGQTVFFAKGALHQWGWIGLLAGLLGWSVTFRKHGRLLLAGVLAGPFLFLLSNLPLHENTTAPILEPYWILVNLIWMVAAAVGIYELFRRIKHPALQSVMALGLIGICAGTSRSSVTNFRDHFYAYDLGRNMLCTLPFRAVMYDPDDPVSFTLRNLQLVERRREDVAVLNFFRTFWGYRQIAQRWPDLLPAMPLRTGQELEQAFWTYSIRSRPFYADLPMKFPPAMHYAMEGVLYRAVPTGAAPGLNDLRRAEQLFELYSWHGVWRTRRNMDFFTRHLLDYLAAAYCNLGLKYAERRDWDAARNAYARALSVDPELSAAYNDLGVTDFEQGRWDAAIRDYRLALRWDPENKGFRDNLALALQRAHSYPH